MTDPVTRARGWLGTPYVHQASRKGVGTDCLGLLRGLWREIYGAEPEAVPGYTRDWSEVSGQERLLEAATRHLRMVPQAGTLPGDILIFRMRGRAVAKHVGILARPLGGAPTFIHAYERAGVVESPLSAAWARRIAGVFRLPQAGED